MKNIANTILICCLVTIGGTASTAQTLTTTLSFTASGLIGTPATATTPFQGITFSNTQVTITTIGDAGKRVFDGYACYMLPNAPASVNIQGVGNYQIAITRLLSCPTVDPV